MDEIQEKVKTNFVTLGFVGRAEMGKAGCFVAKD
jgi:hypothetical protein